MRYRRTIAAAVYLAFGAAVSYLVWGPWGGVDPRPHSWWVYFLIIAFHTGVGLVIGRWWALALPLAWALLSLGAEGYDTPVWILIAFQTPFLWVPAIALGVAGSKLATRAPVWP
jgi:hypothetical protein